MSVPQLHTPQGELNGDTDIGRSVPDGLSQAEPKVLSLRASIPSASGLRKVASQLRHNLSNMELRSNVSWPASSPAAKTSGYIISEVADWQLRQWLHIVENVAQAIEARSGETPSGSTVGESAVATPCAPETPA